MTETEDSGITRKELVNIPLDIKGLKQVNTPKERQIQYKSKGMVCRWNIDLNYISCLGNSKRAKSIRQQLEKIQGKPPKDIKPFGTKQKEKESLINATEKTNKQQDKNKAKGKSNTAYIPSRIEILNAFRDCDTQSLSEILTEGNSILMVKIAKRQA